MIAGLSDQLVERWLIKGGEFSKPIRIHNHVADSSINLSNEIEKFSTQKIYYEQNQALSLLFLLLSFLIFKNSLDLLFEL